VKTLLALEDEHGERRSWVWAELGQSPLAGALLSLADLAWAVTRPHGAGTPEELASRYTSGGWKADRTALEALSSVEIEKDSAAVRTAVEALYRPWLEESTRRFQEAVASAPLPSPLKDAYPSELEEGVCILFTDGLRYDVACYLAELLAMQEAVAEVSWRFSALPGITRTAKPVVSPVGPLLSSGNGFDAKANGSKITADSLRRTLRDKGHEILQSDETGFPDRVAWTEFGDLDSMGHNRGWKLAREVWRSPRDLAGRITALLEAGWSEVRVITDHGWLLMPDGLPKVELPEHLTVVRKGRCARLKEGSRTFLPVSSSGHLLLSQYFIGMDQERFGLSFDAAIHTGTLLAVVLFFRRDLLAMARAFLGSLPPGLR
jgi:Bacitracin resistance protein BacA/PglZ domain